MQLFRSYTPQDSTSQNKANSSLSTVSTISWIGMRFFEKPRKVELHKRHDGYGFSLKMTLVCSSKPYTLYQQNGNWQFCLFFFFVSVICRFVQSAWLFSSWFTRAKNMPNQISRIRVNAKKLFNKSKLCFFNALLFFYARLFIVY